MSYSTQKISITLLDEIKKALQSVSYGSIEIYVNDKTVTQISIRSIKKTSFTIEKSTSSNGKFSHPSGTNEKIEVLTIKK